MSTTDVDVIKGIYKAFSEGDIPNVLGAMAHDIEWNEAENFPYADGNPYVGPSEVLEGVFKRLGTEWEYFRVALERVIDGGQTVVALGRYQAKNRETHREINAQFTHVWDLKDGKIVKFQQYTDTLQVQRAVANLGAGSA